MQRTSTKFGQKMMPLIAGTCHAADIGQMWQKNDAPCRRTLSHCGLWPNVFQLVPLVRGLCLTVDFNQCGPKCAPHWRTLSHCGLQLNVVQNVPLVGGLCLTVDFNQMWFEMCHSLEDFVMLWTLTKCGPNMCSLTDDFVLLWSLTTYGSTTYSSSKKLVPNKQSLSINQFGTETTIFDYVAIRSIHRKVFVPMSLNKKMMHLTSIMRQMTNDADCTQPSPIQHGTQWERSKFL